VIVWVDGRFVRPDEHAIAATDHGVLVGDGVFESVRVDRGVAFELDRHLTRLQRSADTLRLPLDRSRVEDGVDAVLGMDLPDPARLRITVTSGVGPLGSARGDGPPVVSVIGAALVPARPVADVVIVDWPRNERSPLAGVKATSYVENVLALTIAREHGADEALFANTVGNLCEGTGSNVFVGVDGHLVTPPLSAGCLAGVTREILGELVDVVEADVSVDDLRRADEAFLTATTRRVQPIVTIDGRALPHCPGPLTRAAAAAFARHCGNPAPDWRGRRRRR
jgi:branched-chain amino acid aminotransferase